MTKEQVRQAISSGKIRISGFMETTITRGRPQLPWSSEPEIGDRILNSRTSTCQRYGSALLMASMTIPPKHLQTIVSVPPLRVR